MEFLTSAFAEATARQGINRMEERMVAFGGDGTEAGITDAAYEAIPSQLLLLLRPDSIGALYPTNEGMNLQFSGSDALSYVVQQSPDLVNWTAISTNNPVQGVFNVTIPSIPAASQQFYRSVLLP